MNNSRIRIRVVTLFLCLGLLPLMSGGAFADDLVKFPMGSAAWSVAITPHKSAAPARAKSPPAVDLVKIEVTQDHEKIRNVMEYSNGDSRAAWSFVGLSLMMTQDPVGTVFFSAGPLPMSASAFAWLRPADLQEKQPIDYEGRKCFHYRGEMKIISNSDGSEATLKQEAWIDSTKLLPVALDDGTELGVFTFQKTPPDEPLVLPPNYSKLLAIKKRILGLP